jgi:hypothetical protein
LLAPRLELDPMDFHRAKDAIAGGYEAMEQAAPVLRRLMA